MEYRKYNRKTDKNAVHRIWIECGWIENDEKGKKNFDIWVEGVNARVVELNGEPECMVSSSPGELQYLDSTLPLSCITSVTTSRIARKQQLASYLTAKVIAKDAMNGSAISCLGMFEQGYYDQFGYGTGTYYNMVSFDPSQLIVNAKFRIPKRYSKSDWEILHNSRQHRMKNHGATTLHNAKLTHAQMEESSKSFVLGYENDRGDVTHFIWCEIPNNVESGPYFVQAMSYQNYDQFLELMAIIKSWGDQIKLVKMAEPSGIQFQDFLKKPFHNRAITAKSKFEQITRASAFWQMRICNLEKCILETHLNCTDFWFNLDLSDPIENFLTKDDGWTGISGNYIVKLGKNSSVKLGEDESLPTLKTTVNAFTRMWLGVVSATGLSVTDSFEAPTNLMGNLDLAFRLPKPHPDWYF
jgi:hypothetical protein